MKLFLVAMFATCTLTSYGQSMQKYLSETNEMVKQKQYKEALARYIWFQNHALEKEKSMMGVRLSYALSNWKSLADAYPPAMTAFKDMRSNKTRQLLDNNGSADLFADVAAMNRTLGEENKTITLFENIAERQPAKSKICWFWAKRTLFSAKRYDIIKNYLGSALNEFALLKSQFEMQNSTQKNRYANRPELKVYIDKYFAESSLELMQFAIAVNDLKAAKEIREKAMIMVEDYRLRDFKFD